MGGRETWLDYYKDNSSSNLERNLKDFKTGGNEDEMS